MYNLQFDGFLGMNLLSMYFGFSERLKYQTELMRTFRQYGAFEDNVGKLGWIERSILEQIANKEVMDRQLNEIVDSTERK